MTKKLRDNIIYCKSFDFAVNIVNTYKKLCDEKKEYVLSKQLLRSGTSVGANVREGIDAQSKKDFISKFSIALKEACESEYWIELLYETKYLDKDVARNLENDLQEIIKILTSILKTSRNNLSE